MKSADNIAVICKAADEKPPSALLPLAASLRSSCRYTSLLGLWAPSIWRLLIHLVLTEEMGIAYQDPVFKGETLRYGELERKPEIFGFGLSQKRSGFFLRLSPSPGLSVKAFDPLGVLGVLVARLSPGFTIGKFVIRILNEKEKES